MNDNWKTLKSISIDVGENNFIEINLKEPPRGTDSLIGISKGWYNDNGDKRYKTNILFNIAKADRVIKAIKELKNGHKSN